MKKSGFTLIELLVVIAIIGILAALLFPAIQGALLQAKATAAGTQMGGKGLQGMIYAESVDRNAAGMAEIFPRSQATSTAYFQEVYASNYCEGFNFSMLAIPGQTAPPMNTDATLEQAKNMWCAVKGVTSSTDPNVPLFFTKNIAFSGNKLDGAVTVNANADTSGGEGAAILNDKYAIVIYAQGAVKVFKTSRLSRELILGGNVYSNTVLIP